MSKPQKSYTGTVINFGTAPYRHDDNNSPSYFVQLQMNNGQNRTIWAMGLREHLEQLNIQKGEAVNLLDMGVQDGSKRRLWEVERYEPYQELQNSIEHDTEREHQKPAPAISADETKVREQDTPAIPKNTPNLSDFELELPSNIKNNYIAITKNRLLTDEKIHYYDKNDKDQVNIAFEDRKNSLNTSRQDEKTINAMMDLAQSKNWTAIKLKGTEEFKQKAWLEASLRGIETKGYTPSDKDLAELQAKQEERTVNQVEMTAQNPIETRKQEQNNLKEPAVLSDEPQPLTQGDTKTAPEQPDNTNENLLKSELLANNWKQGAVWGVEGIHINKEASERLSGYPYGFYVAIDDKVKLYAPQGYEESEAGRYEVITTYDMPKIPQEIAQLAIKIDQDYREYANQKDWLHDQNYHTHRNSQEYDNQDPSDEYDEEREVYITEEFYEQQLQNFEQSYQATEQAQIANKELTQDEHLLKQHFSNIGEYPLNQNQLNAIENWRRFLTESYKDSPDFVSQKMSNLNDKIPAIANGQFELPPVPDNQIMPAVETPSIQQNNQERTR